MHHQSYTMYIAEGIENKRKEQMEAKIKMSRVWVEVGKSRKTSVSGDCLSILTHLFQVRGQKMLGLRMKLPQYQ